MAKRKWQRGAKITSIDELARQEIVIWVNGKFEKVYSNGCVQSWQLRYVKMSLQQGLLYLAVPTENRKTTVCEDK